MIGQQLYILDGRRIDALHLDAADLLPQFRYCWTDGMYWVTVTHQLDTCTHRQPWVSINQQYSHEQQNRFIFTNCCSWLKFRFTFVFFACDWLVGA